MKRPIMLIDGLNLFMRHYAAHPAISKNGESCGGIVGTLNAIERLSQKVGPSEIYVVWEGHGSVKKRGVYKDYKQSRKPQRLNRYYHDLPDTVSNRSDQVRIIVEALKYTPVRQIYVEGCEADDVIGYMSRYRFNDERKVIVSSDHDYYQLLDNLTLIWSPTLKSWVNKKTVSDRYRVSASNFCLAKSIAGDKSDNIPGVAGISYKTLAKIVPETTSSQEITLDDMFATLREAEKQKSTNKRQRLLQAEQLVRRNWRLIRLDMMNLSLEHVKKVDNACDKNRGTCDKMSMLRMLLKLGINSVRVDNLFLSLKTLQR